MKRLLTALGLFLLAAPLLQAQRFTVGPFYGYRFGGDLENAATGENFRIRDNPSYGIFFDVEPNDSGLKLELFYSFQDTSIDLDGITSPAKNGLDVHVMQIGAIQELYDGKLRPYVGGYLGATYFNLDGFGDELRFSFTLAAGVNYHITKNLGLRLDARALSTVVDGSGGFVCADGGCQVRFAGDFAWQGEVTGSLFLTF